MINFAKKQSFYFMDYRQSGDSGLELPAMYCWIHIYKPA